MRLAPLACGLPPILGQENCADAMAEAEHMYVALYGGRSVADVQTRYRQDGRARGGLGPAPLGSADLGGLAVLCWMAWWRRGARGSWFGSGTGEYLFWRARRGYSSLPLHPSTVRSKGEKATWDAFIRRAKCPSFVPPEAAAAAHSLSPPRHST